MGDNKDRSKRPRPKDNVVPIRPKKPARPDPTAPTPEQVESALAAMAAKVSDAEAVPEAERSQLALLSDLVRPRAAFVSHFVPGRNQLQVMSVRGRNDGRITAAVPGEGAIGTAYAENRVVRDDTLISAPLVARGQVVGCLTLVDPKVAVSDELMRTLAAHLAAAWEVGRLHDEMVRRTRDLETAVAGLKSIEKSRDELISNVSHDLKNPLATIKAYLSMMDRGRLGPLTDKQAHALEVSQRNTDRLTRLINDLVLLSRLRAGDMKLDDKPFGLKALCEEVITSTAGVAQQGGVEVDLRGGEVYVRGDKKRLDEALTHVIEQALFATPEGGRVKVEIDTDEGLARVSVTDQGTPLPESELDHVFDTYARSSQPRVRRTTLNLPIAAKIVRLHGGRVAARAHPVPPAPAPGRPVALRHHDATTVELLLPMYAGAVTPAELPQAPRSGGILLVEDDADCREVLQEVLEQEGYRVIATASAADARSVLSNIRPALVFLDIHLQDEDGRAVLRFIRETPAIAEVPVFIISGASDLGAIASGRGPDRIDGFLEKPLQLPRLLDTVASVVRPRRPPAA